MNLQKVGHQLRFQRLSVCGCLFVFLCLFTAVLAGCSTPPPPPAPLPVLHGLGLVRLDAFARIEASTNNTTLNSLLAYDPVDEPATTHLLIQQIGVLYDAQLDTSGSILAVQSPTCYTLGGIAVKSGAALCQGKAETSGIIAFQPEAVSSDWSGQLLLSGSTADEGYRSPTWRPDGHVFAVVHTKDGTSDIALFAVDAAVKHAHQVATLTLPHIPQLLIQWLSWSSDGTWLTFAGGAGHVGTTYGLHISTLLPQLPTANGNNQQVMVDGDQLVTLIKYPIIGQPWQPGTNNLVYFDGKQLMEWNMLTGQHRVLLPISDGNICGMTWTPDGHRLIFAHCRFTSSDIIPPPAQIYVYTMP